MRYRLRTLLIVVAVVGVTVGSYVAGTRLRRAERELQVLREETGRLTIGDRSKIHVINVAVDEPNTWRWRVFIPKGQKYSWNLAAKDIPQFDAPQPYFSYPSFGQITNTLNSGRIFQFVLNVRF